MSLHRRVVHFATSAILVALIFASCGSGDVVRLPDCIDCRPVELSLDQTLEVELGSDRAVTNDPDAYTWDVTETGTMTLVSEDRGTRPEDEDEFVGGYSRYVVFSFEPTEIGSTQLQFKLVPTDGERPQTSTADEHSRHRRHHRLTPSARDNNVAGPTRILGLLAERGERGGEGISHRPRMVDNQRPRVIQAHS